MCNNMMIQFMMAMQQMPYMWAGQTGLNLPYTNTIMPSWGNKFTPYYNFSNTSNEGAGGTNNSTNNLVSTQNMMNQLGFTPANGYSVAQTSDGSLQFTYNKDGKTYVVNSLANLINQMNENKDTTPAGSLEDSITIHKEENEEVPEDDAVDDGVGHDEAGAPDSAPAGKFKKASDMKLANKDLEWKSYSQIDANTNKWKNSIKNNITVDELVNIMASKGTDEEKQKYKQWLIDANPNAIKDGKVADVNKLDLPVYKAASTANTKKATYKNKVSASSSRIASEKSEDGGLKLQYFNSQNCIYKKNGNGNFDTDAVFKINAHEYTISPSNNNGYELDYWQITGERSWPKTPEYEIIDPKTGHFNKSENLYKNINANGVQANSSRSYVLNGDGPLKGATIKLEDGQVYLFNSQGTKLGLMDDIMLGNVKV